MHGWAYKIQSMTKFTASPVCHLCTLSSFSVSALFVAPTRCFYHATLTSLGPQSWQKQGGGLDSKQLVANFFERISCIGSSSSFCSSCFGLQSWMVCRHHSHVDFEFHPRLRFKTQGKLVKSRWKLKVAFACFVPSLLCCVAVATKVRKRRSNTTEEVPCALWLAWEWLWRLSF